MSNVNSQTSSPSTLLLLFADRFAPHTTALSKMTLTEEYATLSSGIKVKALDLAAMLCAAAIFDLRDRGIISLTPTESKDFGFLVTKSAKVSVLQESGQPGFLGLIMAAAKSVKEPSVRDLAFNLFTADHPDPPMFVAELVEQEALALGFLQPSTDKPGMMEKVLHSKPKLKPVAEKLAELKSELEEFSGRWHALQTTEHDLYEAVVSECTIGVNTRKLVKNTLGPN